MKVNDACLKKKEACLAHINKTAPIEKKTGKFKGNPASSYCLALGGDSVILKDKSNNEYDYCRFSNAYYIDSWDLYEREKKWKSLLFS